MYANKAIQQREVSSFDYNLQESFPQGVDNGFADFSSNVISDFFHLIENLIGPILFFTAFYILVKSILVYKGTGGKEAADSIGKDVKAIITFTLNILKSIGGFFGRIFSFFWKKKWGFIGVFGVMFFFVLLMAFEVVSVLRVRPGQKAIDVSSETILNPGMHIVSPIISDYIISHIANYQFDITEVTADSQELQDVILHINLGVHLDQEQLIPFYAREGVITIWDVANSIVTPRAVEKIKNIVMNYSFKEVHSKQMEIKDEALKEIKAVLAPLGIVLDDLNIVNIRIAPKFVDVLGDREIIDEKIEVAEKSLNQEKLETEMELEIAKRNKQKNIIEAEGIAESNRIINQQKITEQMLQLKKIDNYKYLLDKWDGKLPEHVEGDFSLSSY